MTGYQETVTDPSFAEQLVCFTAPMIGNYGVAAHRAESTGAHASAVLMREARGPEWTNWLREHGIVALTGIDTRSLVLRLRECGAMRAVAVATAMSEDDAVAALRAQPGMQGRSLVSRVSTPQPYVHCDAGSLRVAVVDYGCKRSILRRLAGAGAHVTVFPHSVDAGELLTYDAVLLSNGPGDPEPLTDEVQVVRSCSAASRCSASASATSCSGWRPATTPTSSRSATAARTTRCSSVARPRARHESESRLRGRALRGDEATHVSLYDGTVEGFDFPELRARSVQFHPRQARAARRVADPRTLAAGGPRCRVDETCTRSA